MNPIGTAVGGAATALFDDPTFQVILAGVFLFMVVFWMVASYWAFRDMHDRTENLLWPFLVAALIFACLPFFFPLGLLAYRIVRPPERLADVYERNLSEQALLAEVEMVMTCHGCDRRVDDEWIICPWCRNRLKRVCPNCDRLVGLEWSICAWCAKDFELSIVPKPVARQSKKAKVGSQL